jgi:membrane associated rhomboid family serine protease
MTPWVRRLLLANVVMFFLVGGGPTVPGVLPGFYGLLALHPRFILIQPWGLVTYMFLHSGFMHILFNMLGLFFLGPRLEARLGGSGFLRLYFISGITGGLFSLLPPYYPVVGASAAVFGVFLGFALFWPRERLYLMGILPVEARILVFVLTVLSLYGGIDQLSDGIAHLAHLGGFVGGFVYLKWRDLHSPQRQFKRMQYANRRRRPGGDQADLNRWRQIRREQIHEVNRDELDRLMAKIEEEGVASLAVEERAFLDRMHSQ